MQGVLQVQAKEEPRIPVLLRCSPHSRYKQFKSCSVHSTNDQHGCSRKSLFDTYIEKQKPDSLELHSLDWFLPLRFHAVG